MPGKYGNKKTFYQGVQYDSRREANCAAQLDVLKRAGEITTIERQVTIELLPKPNRITYRADFVVTKKDGSKKIVEAKGYWTAVAKLKMKLLKHFYPKYEVDIY